MCRRQGDVARHRLCLIQSDAALYTFRWHKARTCNGKSLTAGKKSSCQTRPEARASRILLGERPPTVMACDSSPVAKHTGLDFRFQTQAGGTPWHLQGGSTNVRV